MADIFKKPMGNENGKQRLWINPGATNAGANWRC